MNILEKIIAGKRKEVAERKSLFPLNLLERSLYFSTDCVSLVRYLKDPAKSGVIAEFKRRSPSKGAINPYASVEQVTIGYMQAGASALSVLTDSEYFGGASEDLMTARNFNYCPILRKDFIIDEYQVIEAKSIGADAILLIAACLTPEGVKHLARRAKGLGMEVLLEIHHAEELGHACQYVDVIGVNNRNLTDFSVSADHSHRLLPLLPAGITRISESGISDPAVAASLLHAGYDGLLIGESFMKQSQPEWACLEFIQQVKRSLSDHKSLESTC